MGSRLAGADHHKSSGSIRRLNSQHSKLRGPAIAARCYESCGTYSTWQSTRSKKEVPPPGALLEGSLLARLSHHLSPRTDPDPTRGSPAFETLSNAHVLYLGAIIQLHRALMQPPRDPAEDHDA
jgi:hypothetical protein